MCEASCYEMVLRDAQNLANIPASEQTESMVRVAMDADPATFRFCANQTEKLCCELVSRLVSNIVYIAPENRTSNVHGAALETCIKKYGSADLFSKLSKFLPGDGRKAIEIPEITSSKTIALFFQGLDPTAKNRLLEQKEDFRSMVGKHIEKFGLSSADEFYDLVIDYNPLALGVFPSAFHTLDYLQRALSRDWRAIYVYRGEHDKSYYRAGGEACKGQMGTDIADDMDLSLDAGMSLPVSF